MKSQTEAPKFVNPKPFPAAACRQCGGWSGSGGCSQHRNSVVPVHGRTGCTCFT